MGIDRTSRNAFGVDRHRSSHPDLTDDEWELFQGYFAPFPWDGLPDEAVGFDLGCGTGLTASLISQRASRLHLISSSEDDLAQAEAHLADCDNCSFHRTQLTDLECLPDGSMDFGYSIGALGLDAVDVGRALSQCARKLKPGAPFLLYLLYDLDNRPLWFRTAWLASDAFRRVASLQPAPVKRLLADTIAATAYWPLARAAAVLETAGARVDNIPLSPYRRATFDTMRAGAWERFSRRDERRFAANEIRDHFEARGFGGMTFSDEPPYWSAVAYRSEGSP